VELTSTVIWLLVPFVIFRAAGKFVGAWVAARALGRISALDLGAYLLSPGVLGIALALNCDQVAGSEAGVLIVSTVTLAALVGELLASYALAGPSASRPPVAT